MFRRHYVHRSKLVGTGIIAFLAGAAAWAIFGRKLKRKMDENPNFQEMKREVYDKASRISDLTQEKYDALVDEVSQKYAQAKGISRHELRDLASDLRWHWKRIRESWKNNRYNGTPESY